MDGEDELLHWAVDALAGSPEPWPSHIRSPPLRVLPAGGPCRRVIYTTKVEWLERLVRSTGTLPPDLALIGRWGPADEQARAAVRRQATTLAAALSFVGDLDPLDLATFATLNRGGLQLRYLGIADAWLERCRADLAGRAEWSLERVCLSMGDDERAGLERLAALHVDWPGLVGPRSWALLQCGLKLELEGASSPRLYSDSFRTELLARLFA